MDISAAPKLLTLRLQPAPAGLRITSYMVKVLRTLEDNSWVTNQTILKVKENNTEDILIYRYDTKLKFGKYKFMVYPQHIDCKEDMCAVSSPEYLIGNASNVPSNQKLKLHIWCPLSYLNFIT